MLKNTAFVCVLLLGAGLASAQTLVWSEPETVAPAAFDNNRPRIALTAGGIPVVLWTKNAQLNTIYTSRKTGSSFSAPVQANPVNTDPHYSSMEGPNLAAVNDTVFLVYTAPSSTLGNVYAVRSVDGGATYGNAVQVNPSGSSVAEIPAVIADRGGNPFVLYIEADANYANPRQVMLRSTDGGLTYGSVQDVSLLAPGIVCECCPPTAVKEGNSFVALFRNNDSNLRDIWATISHNGGQLLASSHDIDSTGWMVNSCPTSGPDALMDADSIITVWMSEASGKPRIYMSTMNVHSTKLSSTRMIAGGQGSFVQNLPSIAGKGDTLGVVWQDNRNNTYDCGFSWSMTGAEGLVSSLAWVDSSAGDQYNVDIAYSKGVFHFVYQDDKTNTVKYRTATVSNSTSVSNPAPLRSLSVVPNPMKEESEIVFGETKRSVQVLISDLSGKLLRRYSVQNTDRLRIRKQELGAGMYFVTAYTPEGGLFRAKMVIE
jgi:hypothetical protein